MDRLSMVNFYIKYSPHILPSIANKHLNRAFEKALIHIHLITIVPSLLVSTSFYSCCILKSFLICSTSFSHLYTSVSSSLLSKLATRSILRVQEADLHALVNFEINFCYIGSKLSLLCLTFSQNIFFHCRQ